MANGMSFKSPPSKLIGFFKKSRDSWKKKHHGVKKSCKYWQNQARAVEKSRKVWRERAEASEQRVAELEAEIEDLKFSNG